MIGAESIGFFGSQFRFVVETLNNAAGELAFARNQFSSSSRLRLS